MQFFIIMHNRKLIEVKCYLPRLSQKALEKKITNIAFVAVSGINSAWVVWFSYSKELNIKNKNKSILIFSMYLDFEINLVQTF